MWCGVKRGEGRGGDWEGKGRGGEGRGGKGRGEERRGGEGRGGEGRGEEVNGNIIIMLLQATEEAEDKGQVVSTLTTELMVRPPLHTSTHLTHPAHTHTASEA